ncbi:MAG TPA: DUF4097 family beta strand repeat-containing protein [Acidimicrobiales bacterium]|nr:DUF4097 family beta strand repeat-containing protein [Acidimicrobiales bacterium]
MNRRLLAALIALVGTAGIVVAALVVFFPEKDRTTLAQPGPVRSLEVDVEVGKVEVVPGDGEETMITRTRRYLVGAPVARESLVGEVLRIEAACDGPIAAGCAVDYRVEVPAGVPVRIRTQRGSVSVTGMTGAVEVDAGAGNVRLIRTTGPVKVDTSAGNVEGVDVVAPFLDATTGAGRIRLSMAEPPGRLGLKTGAGNIDVGLPTADGGYRVAPEAGAGKVNVTVEQNEGGSRSIMATTSAGNIRIHPR